MGKAADHNPDERTHASLKSVAAAVAKVTKPQLAKRGLAEGQVVAEWPTIVGATLARHTCPLKIAFNKGERGDGTLHIRVASGALAMELQHLEPLVLQRINGYFGYRAVARIALSQGPVPKPSERKIPKEPQLTPEQQASLSQTVDAVDDPDLRAVLERLGRHLQGGPR